MIEARFKTFWRRFWAGWIDSFVFLPISLSTNWMWHHHESVPTLVLVLIYILTSVMWYAYSICLHGKYGQTLGKMALKVRVMDLSEDKPISFAQAIKRDIVPLAITLVLLPHDIIGIARGEHYLLNPGTMPDTASMAIMYVMMAWAILEIVTMLFSSKRRALHDFIAGSVVINLKAPTRKSSLR